MTFKNYGSNHGITFRHFQKQNPAKEKKENIFNVLEATVTKPRNKLKSTTKPLMDSCKKKT